jgi:succinate dehydrogenase / fumarate reductase iron-sulfur subunit
MAPPTVSLTLRIWRQAGPAQSGGFETFQLCDVSTDLSLLEALDLLNERLIGQGQRPVGFEHDCREGICGSCGFLVNGQAHGPQAATTVCQLYLRQFRDGATLTLEPWRARAFPVLQDLGVDRSGLDRILAAGGLLLREHRPGAGGQQHPGRPGAG